MQQVPRAAIVWPLLHLLRVWSPLDQSFGSMQVSVAVFAAEPYQVYSFLFYLLHLTCAELVAR